jgi:hypothetical protein
MSTGTLATAPNAHGGVGHQVCQRTAPAVLRWAGIRPSLGVIT